MVKKTAARKRILRNWHTLHAHLMVLSEAAISSLISVELKRDSGSRRSMLLRLHQRYAKLRGDRERRDLLDRGRWPPR